MNWLFEFLNNFSKDALIQTIGGFIGALLAGLIAVGVFKAQVIHERNERKIAEIEGFLRKYHAMMRPFDIIENNLKVPVMFEEGNTHRKNHLAIYVQMKPHLEEQYRQLVNINDDQVPYDIHLKFTEYKLVLQGLITTLDEKIEIGDNDALFYYPSITEYSVVLNELRTSINNFADVMVNKREKIIKGYVRVVFIKLKTKIITYIQRNKETKLEN